MIENFDVLSKATSLAQKRGMKVSRAATRLGLPAQAAKACSVAAEIQFLETEGEFVSAAARIGQSCMTKTPEAYRYWFHASTDDGIKPVRVAVYRDSRCLVRVDTLEFVQVYGTNSGDLRLALIWLGYRENRGALTSLSIPSNLVEGKKTVEMFSYPVQEYWYQYPDHAGNLVVVKDRPHESVVPAYRVKRVYMSTTWKTHTKRVVVNVPRPYCDGLRKLL